MHCPEIDITKPRFGKKQLILCCNNIHALEPGEHLIKFQEGKKEEGKGR